MSNRSPHPRRHARGRSGQASVLTDRRRQSLPKRIAFDRLVDDCALAASKCGLRVSARKGVDVWDRPPEFVRQFDHILESFPDDVRPPRQSLAARSTAVARSLARRKIDPSIPAATGSTLPWVEALCPFVALLHPLIQSETARTEDDSLPPEKLIRDVPSGAFDMYSGEGRTGLSSFPARDQRDRPLGPSP
jgi:hypothetical protein